MSVQSTNATFYALNKKFPITTIFAISNEILRAVPTEGRSYTTNM